MAARVQADYTEPLPESVSLVDAAGTFSAYNACQQALIHLARIRKGKAVGPVMGLATAAFRGGMVRVVVPCLQ